MVRSSSGCLWYWSCAWPWRVFLWQRCSCALELLLVTPLPEAYILRGLALSFRRKLAPLRGLVIFTNIAMAFVVLNWGSAMGMDGAVIEIFLMLFLGGTLMVYLDFKA